VNQHWFSVIGLVLDLVGAVLIIFKGTFLSKIEKNRVLSVSPSDVAMAAMTRWNEASPEFKKTVELMERASAWSLRGFVFIAFGAVFQIIGSWPTGN
jgi:hypothetical protein